MQRQKETAYLPQSQSNRVSSCILFFFLFFFIFDLGDKDICPSLLKPPQSHRSLLASEKRAIQQNWIQGLHVLEYSHKNNNNALCLAGCLEKLSDSENLLMVESRI